MQGVIRRIRLAVPLAIVGAALMLPGQALAGNAPCRHAGDNPDSITLRQARLATLCLLNKIRHRHGLRKFHRNRRLGKAARRHSRAMARHHFFAHGDFLGRIRSARYLRGSRSWTVGENIAWGSFDYATPRSIVRGWMHSPPHRANILSGRFREIGIGVARGGPMSGVSRAATYTTDFGARG